MLGEEDYRLTKAERKQLRDAAQLNDQSSDGNSITVFLWLERKNHMMMMVVLRFRDPKQSEIARILDPGDSVRAMGKIEAISGTQVTLEECEMVTDDAP